MKPVLQALVLAEHVYTDKSGKKIIAGTFNSYSFKRGSLVEEKDVGDGAPVQVIKGGMQVGSPYAYISLTDVCNNTELLLQFVNLSKNQVLLQSKINVVCHDRLQTIEIIAPLPQLPCREPGTYAFEVVCEDEVIGSHRVISRELP